MYIDYILIYETSIPTIPLSWKFNKQKNTLRVLKGIEHFYKQNRELKKEVESGQLTLDNDGWF